MEEQSNGSVKPPVRDGVIEGVKYSGWVSLFVPGGWFRKRWVKKWCVLMDDRLFLYDSQSINNNETKRNSHAINLLQCARCGDPEAKELKKNPNSFVMEMKSSYTPITPKKKGKKDSQKLPQELFSVEDEEEKNRWLAKLEDAIAANKQAEKTNLDHVTKTRPKPRAVQRRPPSRHHIRQLATQSQLLPGDFGFDSNPEPDTADSLSAPSESKGTPPAIALKPPKVKVSKDKEEESKKENAQEQSPSSEEKPVPTPRRRSTLTPSIDEVDGVKTPSRSNSPIPPPTPSKSLKPKLVRSTDDVTQATDDSESGPSTPALPHVLPLKFPGLRPTAAPRSTRSLDRRDLFEQAKARSAHNLTKADDNVDSKTTHVKSQALKLPAFPETDSALVGKRGKSRSMTLLDRFEDLPPPPVPPPAESVSDIELSSENIRARKKKLRKKRSSSTATTTDEDE